MILAITERVAKFCHPQYRSITQQVESKNLHAVVRAPEMTSDHQAWIDKYRPKEITGAPTAPASPALKALAVASEVAERVGVSNDDIIRKEAIRLAEKEPAIVDGVFDTWNSRYLKNY